MFYKFKVVACLPTISLIMILAFWSCDGSIDIILLPFS
jgi:hypothetical protein